MFKRYCLFIFILLWAFAHPAWAVKYKGDLETNESLVLPEQSATPVSPSASKFKLYMKNDGVAYSLDASGNENPLASDGFKNKIINGNFDLWQRGASFTGWNQHYSDRWRSDSNTDDSVSVSRQSFTLGQTDVPGEPRYFIRLSLTAGSTGTVNDFRQRIESVRTFAGEVVTVSFYARSSSAASLTSNTRINQVFGTGGTPSSEVSHTLGSFSLTTSWQKFSKTVTLSSLSGKTLGSNGDDYLDLVFSLPVNTTVDIEIARVQLERGSIATRFEPRPMALELVLAQRYYEKSFPQGTAPAQNTGRTGALEWASPVSGTVTFVTPVDFRVVKRGVPTITFYNPSAANGEVRNQSDAADCSSTVASNAGESGMQVQTTANSAATSGDTLSIHWAANSEL